MANACGVDFGTSNSTVGWARPGQSTMLGLEDGKTTLPSVVFFNAEDEEVSFGRAALAGYLAGYEGRLMRSLKSLLGTSLIDGQTEVGGRALPFRLLLSQFIGEVNAAPSSPPGASSRRPCSAAPSSLSTIMRRPTSWRRTPWPKWRARSVSRTWRSSSNRSPPPSTMSRR